MITCANFLPTLTIITIALIIDVRLFMDVYSVCQGLMSSGISGDDLSYNHDRTTRLIEAPGMSGHDYR